MQKIKNSLKHIRSLIVNPKRFFTRIVADGNMEESMFKAYIYGLIGGILVLAGRLIGGATITFSAVFTAIIIVPVLAVALLFIMGGLLMLVSEIAGGERDWEIAIKGLASVFFVYPMVLVLNALAFNCVSLWIISVAVDAYLLFLFYNIALYCMHGRRGYVLTMIAIIAVFLLTVYMTDYRMGWLMLKNTSAAWMCI